MTDSEREKILGALNFKDENGEERKQNNDSWLPIFLTLFSMFNSQTPNIALEKEVAYLHGKVDTLEKIITERE